MSQSRVEPTNTRYGRAGSFSLTNQDKWQLSRSLGFANCGTLGDTLSCRSSHQDLIQRPPLRSLRPIYNLSNQPPASGHRTTFRSCRHFVLGTSPGWPLLLASVGRIFAVNAFNRINLLLEQEETRQYVDMPCHRDTCRVKRCIACKWM